MVPMQGFEAKGTAEALNGSAIFVQEYSVRCSIDGY